jgi:hypothetical protein
MGVEKDEGDVGEKTVRLFLGKTADHWTVRSYEHSKTRMIRHGEGREVV